MKPLEISDVHQLRAAQGWLELGNAAEALREVAGVSEGAKDHPAVLEIRFEIFAKQNHWDAARDVAEAITAQIPDIADGWLHLAYAARRCTGGSEQAAYEILLPKAEKFPDEATIPYNLACYTCQLGRLDEARKWLKRAFTIGNITQLKLMALADQDLKPLWKEIPPIEP